MSFQLPLEQEEKPRYLHEFPDFGEMDVAIPFGMIDASLQKNTCPSFEMSGPSPDEAPVVTLFVGYKDTAKGHAMVDGHAIKSRRFSLFVGDKMDVPALSTDDWDEAKRFIELRRPFAGFEHEGMHITNPTCEDGGARFVVSPQVYGFEIEETGGGCTAWVRYFPLGGSLVLTDLSGTSHHLGDELQTFLIGVYDGAGEEVSMHHAVVGLLSNVGARFIDDSAIPPDVKFLPLAMANYGITSGQASAVALENSAEHRQVQRASPAIPDRIFDHVGHAKAIADLEAMGLQDPSPAEITSQAVFNASAASAMVLESLRKSLAQAVNFLEHKLANEGQSPSSEEWDANVKAFRQRQVGHLGIGHDHIDKASMDFSKARSALAGAHVFLAKHLPR